MSFLDTDVAIDVYRGHASAREWLRGLGDTPTELAGFVRFEIVQGARTKADLLRVDAFLSRFRIIWPTGNAMSAALADYERLGLSHGIGIFDCLIAHTALERGATLYSFNRKHYGLLSGLDVREPYAR